MSLTIPLDLRLSASLKWQEEEKMATEAIQRGVAIIWELEMGLFDQLPLPLNDEAQLLSLQLAMDHFKKTLLEPFLEHTKGVILYRGSADFSLHFPFHEEKREDLLHLAPSLYCREICVDFLAALLAQLPESVETFLVLDASTIGSKAQRYRLLCKERFEHFSLIVDGHDFVSDASLGILLPNSLCNRGWDEFAKVIESMDRPYKVVSEAFLNMEWDGLDTLIVIASAISFQGRRKLNGFTAAGGVVEYIS